MSFLAPNMPQAPAPPPPPPTPPVMANGSVQASAAAARNAAAAAAGGGFGDTVKSGGADGAPTPNFGKKALLGQ